MKAKYCIQCNDKWGDTGCFIFTGSLPNNFQQISPTFSDLGYLYQWMNVHGWSHVPCRYLEVSHPEANPLISLKSWEESLAAWTNFRNKSLALLQTQTGNEERKALHLSIKGDQSRIDECNREINAFRLGKHQYDLAKKA